MPPDGNAPEGDSTTTEATASESKAQPGKGEATHATEPTPAPDELKALRDQVAALQAEKKAKELEAMGEKERAEAELAEKKAELARLDEELAYRRSGLDEAGVDFLSKFQNMTPDQRAKALTKLIKTSKADPAPETTGKRTPVLKPITPASGAAPATNEKTPEEVERDRYATSKRWGRNPERKAS